MLKPLRISLRVIACLLALVLLAALAYVAYVVFSYSRIPDHQPLAPEGEASALAQTGRAYTVVTQNLGFGAYTPGFTFFMDGGVGSRAESPESVRSCIEEGARTVAALSPDFVFFQEVDIDSDRSYHIDERTLLSPFFEGCTSVFAQNYHSAYLFYPFYEPHGASQSGLLTVSRLAVSQASRRSLPISEGFSKFLDLDRCYSVSRVPCENGKELVLFNVLLSAYGGSDEIRTAQMTQLLSDMQAEFEKGNYAVCGGDFNHDFTGRSTQDLNGGESVDFGWAQPFPDALLAQTGCVRRADGYQALVPTCRNCDVPYQEGNFTIIVDGFLVTENVEILSVQNVDTRFSYSDHNPSVLRFLLK